MRRSPKQCIPEKSQNSEGLAGQTRSLSTDLGRDAGEACTRKSWRLFHSRNTPNSGLLQGSARRPLTRGNLGHQQGEIWVAPGRPFGGVGARESPCLEHGASIHPWPKSLSDVFKGGKHHVGYDAIGDFPNIARAVCLLIVGAALAGCGINTIPTLQERAKASWSEVLNQYQRRADLIPNLVETVKGYAAQESKVLTEVTRGARQGDASPDPARHSHQSRGLPEIPRGARHTDRRAKQAPRHHRELSRPQVKPELPRAAIAARRHREPHRRRAARLHLRGAGLQYRDQDDSRPLVARAALS